MHRLAIDTATAVGRVALGAGDQVIAERSVAPKAGAGGLVPAIHECLASGGIDVTGLDEILLADGPGSFTGLRVGFATVAGLVGGRALPVRTVPSLVATAWGANQAVGPRDRSVGPVDGRIVVAVYDALRGEVFAARCAVSSDRLDVIDPPALTTVADVVRREPNPHLLVSPDPGLLAGVADHGEGVRTVEAPDVVRAAHLLGMASVPGAIPAAGTELPVHPNYGRQAEAQVRWEREHGRTISDSPGHRR